MNPQDKIIETIDRNKFSLGISIDLAKAFCSVNHTIGPTISKAPKLLNKGTPAGMV